MEKKYQLLATDTCEIANTHTLYRVQALRDFADVRAGDLGGYVEEEANLSHEGEIASRSRLPEFPQSLAHPKAQRKPISHRPPLKKNALW